MNIKVSSIKFIGVKEFRKNLSKYIKQAQRSDKRFIITSHNEPLFEITPLAESIYKKEFLEGLEEAMRESREGKAYSHEEVFKELIG